MTKRALWLIDGSYLYKAMRSYQQENAIYENKGIDYKRLKYKIMDLYGMDEIDSFYFNSTPDPSTDAQSAYHTWLKSAEPKGPNIRVKLYDLKAKTIYCPSCNRRIVTKVQKGVDVGIATTALKLYQKYDLIVLSAGDGDFEDFIRYLVEDRDKKLCIVGFDGSISPDIQQYSSQIYFLNESYNEICDARGELPLEVAEIYTEAQ